ncbi:MAG: SRPBCC domain-containing protein [Proteobacteria bacterium]|nr:SRPBCC domain-containing protein [Pseudomonadota bacterium]
MIPITATLHVEASADWIWALITHFAKYADWNRLVPRIEGEPQLNRRLRLTLAAAGRRPIALKARVLVAARNRELRWQARSRWPGLLKVEHGLRIEQRAGNCRLHHGLSCIGWLASERLIAALRDSFEATNASVLAQTEAIAGAPPATEVAVPIVVAAANAPARIAAIRDLVAGR